MSAKPSVLARIQEIMDIAAQTQQQISSLGFTKERFINPENDQDDLIAEGLMKRAFRITEEARAVSEETSFRYGFETQAIVGVRNKLAHAYGEVDREIIWEVIESNFDELITSCKHFCEDNGFEF